MRSALNRSRCRRHSWRQSLAPPLLSSCLFHKSFMCEWRQRNVYVQTCSQAHRHAFTSVWVYESTLEGCECIRVSTSMTHLCVCVSASVSQWICVYAFECLYPHMPRRTVSLYSVSPCPSLCPCRWRGLRGERSEGDVHLWHLPVRGWVRRWRRGCVVSGGRGKRGEGVLRGRVESGTGWLDSFICLRGCRC